jgi:YD repeat-containing protein
MDAAECRFGLLASRILAQLILVAVSASSPSTVPGANGSTSSGNADQLHLLSSITDPRGQVVMSNQFDAYGRLTASADAQGASTSYLTVGQSWQRMNPMSTTDARGNTTGYNYDAPTQPGATPSSIGEPLGRTTSLGIDGNGNLRNLTIAGELTVYGYDSFGRKASEANALGQSTTYTYDATGNETSRTVTKVVNGQAQTFTTTRKYDNDNRLVEEVDALGAKTTSTYNAAGKLATQPMRWAARPHTPTTPTRA